MNSSINQQDFRAITVPCRTCGAALHLDLVLGRTICSYCHTERLFESDDLERARRHLHDIASLDAQAADAASETDLHRRRRKVGWGWLQPLFPLFVGQYIIITMGVGVATQFLVD